MSEETFTCVYEGMEIPGPMATMWKMKCRMEDGVKKELWGDWRYMRNMSEALKIGQKVIIRKREDWDWSVEPVKNKRVL